MPHEPAREHPPDAPARSPRSVGTRAGEAAAAAGAKLIHDAYLYDSAGRPVAALHGDPAARTWDDISTYHTWVQTMTLPAATREVRLSHAQLLDLAARQRWPSVEVSNWLRERWPDVTGWVPVGRLVPRFPAETSWRLVVRAVMW